MNPGEGLEPKTAPDRLWVALDFPSFYRAGQIVYQIASMVGMFKVGTTLAGDRGWAEPINAVHKMGAEVFADMKLDDKTETIIDSAHQALKAKPKVISVHTTSGTEGMIWAREAAHRAGAFILGVTVLTNLSDTESERIFGKNVQAAAHDLGRLALEAQLDGLICSPHEVAMFRSDSAFDDMKLATPGVRPQWAPAYDQLRIMTPKQAIEAGSDYLIIGRPITKSPLLGGATEAVMRISKEIKLGLGA